MGESNIFGAHYDLAEMKHRIGHCGNMNKVRQAQLHEPDQVREKSRKEKDCDGNSDYRNVHPSRPLPRLQLLSE